MSLDDGLLAKLTREGSSEAIAEIYRRYWPVVCTAAFAVTGRRALADEAAQEAMHRAFRALGDFDTSRSLGPWLKKIAVRVAVDELRRERRHQPLWSEELEAAEQYRPFADDVVAAVEALPEQQRVVIVVHYWLDYRVEDVADLLGLPYGTVASRLSRALAKLRATLEECNVAGPRTNAPRRAATVSRTRSRDDRERAPGASGQPCSHQTPALPRLSVGIGGRSDRRRRVRRAGLAIEFPNPFEKAFPRPVDRGTFICPRYSPKFTVEIGSVSGGIYGQATTDGAPVSRGGSIVYGQVSETNGAVDRVCRRTDEPLPGARPVSAARTRSGSSRAATPGPRTSPVTFEAACSCEQRR